MKKTILILILLVLVGCTQTTVLKNGHTKAPTDPKVFKNKMYFDPSILDQIDTTVIYEEYNDNYYEGLVKQENVLARLNYKNPRTTYSVYRFYGNGCFSLFSLDREKDELTKEMFDPAYRGWRGVLYKKKNKILGDLFTQIGQERWALGKATYEYKFNGDTLIIESQHNNKSIYIKRHIESKLIDHPATW